MPGVLEHVCGVSYVLSSKCGEKYSGKRLNSARLRTGNCSVPYNLVGRVEVEADQIKTELTSLPFCANLLTHREIKQYFKQGRF